MEKTRVPPHSSHMVLHAASSSATEDAILVHANSLEIETIRDDEYPGHLSVVVKTKRFKPSLRELKSEYDGP